MVVYRVILTHLPLQKVHSRRKTTNEGVNNHSDAHTTKYCSVKGKVFFYALKDINSSITKETNSFNQGQQQNRERKLFQGLVSELTDQRKNEVCNSKNIGLPASRLYCKSRT